MVGPAGTVVLLLGHQHLVPLTSTASARTSTADLTQDKLYTTIYSERLESTRREKKTKKTLQHLPQQRILWERKHIHHGRDCPPMPLPILAGSCLTQACPYSSTTSQTLPNVNGSTTALRETRHWLPWPSFLGGSQQNQFIGKVLDAVSVVHDF